MAARYRIGDKVRLTRKESVDHFASCDIAITGEIVEIRENGYDGHAGYGPCNYGIKFGDRNGVWWYAAKEFTRIKGG